MILFKLPLCFGQTKGEHFSKLKGGSCVWSDEPNSYCHSGSCSHETLTRTESPLARIQNIFLEYPRILWDTPFITFYKYHKLITDLVKLIQPVITGNKKIKVFRSKSYRTFSVNRNMTSKKKSFILQRIARIYPRNLTK